MGGKARKTPSPYLYLREGLILIDKIFADEARKEGEDCVVAEFAICSASNHLLFRLKMRV